MAAWNYFQSVDTDLNSEFIQKWHAFTGDDSRVTNDPMEATYIGFNMWAQAVTAAGTTDVDAVEQAMIGQEVPNLTGGVAVMNKNHHLSKPVLIGEIQDDGQFEVVWETEGVVAGDAWSDFLPGSKNLIADWTAPITCGNYTVETQSCGGQAN
jgi:urea transport system substrate-binding protein